MKKTLNACGFLILKAWFKPAVCCAHDWVNENGTVTTQKCASCRAWCRRDRNGFIVDYTRPFAA